MTTETLLVPIGSTGDVLPFLAIGRELRKRGGRVAVLANGYFAGHVERAGLDFLEFGTREEYLEVIGAQRPGELLRALRTMAHHTTHKLCDLVLAHATPQTTLVTHTLAFGARIAGEKLGLQMRTAHLSPAVFDSPREPPVLPGFFNSAERPRWYRSFVQWMYRRAADAVWGGPVRALRKRHGLAALSPSQEGRRPSPLGLFPDWFAPPQPEWPEETVLTGFMLYDDAAEAPRDLAEFLAQRPIVFTPGSGQTNARRFFDAAIEASQRLGKPALLLTRFRDQLPADLPAHVRHAPFLPLGEVLPRASAIVHHGGIGTCAQALVAGVPQLIMPGGFDQLDNAARIERLQAGGWLAPRRFKGPAVERALRELLSLQPPRLTQHESAAARACDAIYSARSATLGSTRAARRAGSHDAKIATSASMRARPR